MRVTKSIKAILFGMVLLFLLIAPASAKVTFQGDTPTTVSIYENGQLVSTIKMADYYLESSGPNIWLVGDYLYLYGLGFEIYDISNPRKPDRVYSLVWEGSPDTIYSMYVDSEIAVLTYESTLTILDVSEPEYTEPLSYTWIESPIYSVSRQDNLLITSLATYDITDPTNPVRITNMNVDTVSTYDKGDWYTLTGNRFVKERFGSVSWEPILGDWDGINADNMGLYSKKTGEFRIRYWDGEETSYYFARGGIPLSGDWNGYTAEQPGVYYPASYMWYLHKIYEDEIDKIQFGWSGVIPITGDWNGDGLTDIGVYNDAGNNFVLKTDAGYEVIGLGWDGVIPVVGDWDGDGKDDVGVYSKDTWVLETNIPNKYRFVGFGWNGVTPIVGDWDDDGKDDVGVYNPENGMYVFPGNPIKMAIAPVGTPIF